MSTIVKLLVQPLENQTQAGFSSGVFLFVFTLYTCMFLLSKHLNHLCTLLYVQ